MRFVDLIEKKKTGHALTKTEINDWIKGYSNGEIPDYQVSALCMAIYFQGMNDQETAWLCEAMLHSGDVMDLSAIHGHIADKHSTGGVGDKTTLALAPMVAACGGTIAKMSGRGLGHTGGTLDKIESISGFNVSQSETAFIQQVNAIHLALIGQTKSLVPADKLLYALRDVTATVNSIPLIASSIMSKKLAAGADTILLDVKYGEGAFMPTVTAAEQLAETMINIGHHFGKDTRAMITNMNQPLGNAIGNALELKEAIATLQGNGPQDFTELCLEAGSIMLRQSELAASQKQAKAMLQEAIQSGWALNKLIEMCKYQGGDITQIEDVSRLPQAAQIVTVKAQKSGYIQALHALTLGDLAMRLGAGRKTKTDTIDHAVGIVLNKKVGDWVESGDVLAMVHTQHDLEDAWINAFHQAYTINREKVSPQPLIAKIIE